MAVYTVEQAKERKRKGNFRPGRDAVDIDWTSIASRPERRKQKGDSKWIRNAADERALSEGCWFDERQAEYVCQWFAKHLSHVVGDWSGKPFELLDWQRENIIYPLFGWFHVDDLGRIVRRHRRTFCFLPKKNGKSTLAAGIGLYMMAAEGQQGTEVYCYGTDRESANIVMETALQMVEHSDTLQWPYKRQFHHKRILNIPLNQCMRSEPATPGTSQGKIGNCAIFDELHAWKSRDLWDSLRYLGSAWPEALHFIITTAGDDKETVCGHLYDRAKAVESGDEYDPELMVYICEAMQGEDIENPEVQKKANPSLGLTISPKQLSRDIDEARGSAMAWAALLRYRFNQWVHGEVPWLDMDAWNDAVRAADLGEMRCVAGLDLARKRDVSSFAMCFIDGETYHFRWKCWLPKDTGLRYSKKVGYLDWAEKGWLTLTEGNVTDYNVIEDDICDLIEEYGIDRLAFDPKYAEELTQRITDETGVERVEFTQTMPNFARPTKLLEDGIASRQIFHDGNGLVRWQANHTKVHEDNDGNIRPIRPKFGDHRTIDAVVAAVMALGVADEDPVDNFYEENELEVV